MTDVDILERTTTYLRSKLGGVPVSASVPAERKSLGSFVTFSRAGGARSAFIDEPRIVADCFAQTIADSYELAERVAVALAGMPADDSKVSDAGPCSIYRNEWAEDGTPCHSVSCPMVANV